MEKLVLTIGNRNNSSWSLRAWLALEQTGAEFEEDQIWLDSDPERKQRLERGPTGRVPVLRHGEVTVWDSLAIGEYLAELFPDAGLWPHDRAFRAHARTIVAEMHSGFFAVRENMPMNCRTRKPFVDRGPQVAAEVERISEIWNDTRTRFGAGGEFLFGVRTLADAFYAPMVSRFETYGIPLDGRAAEYAAAVRAMPALREWCARAEAETHIIQGFDRKP
jgi:glutathione S-transferase